jgi:predicted transcriptional regulator
MAHNGGSRAPRKSNREYLQGLYDLVAAHPGISYNGLAKLAGITAMELECKLVTMSNHGILLSEDGGKLYPCEEANEFTVLFDKYSEFVGGNE